MKDDSWWFLTLFETMFWKLELLRKNQKQRLRMVHSGAIWNDVLEVGTAEKILKVRMLNDVFWCYLKGVYGSLKYRENVESNGENGAYWLYLKICFGTA